MFARFALLCAMLFVTSLTRGGEDPNPVAYRFNYQAKLTDSLGAPLAGTHMLYFTIYQGGTSTSGGTAVYAENSSIDIDNGVVNYALGSGTPALGFLGPQLFNFSNSYYLQVAVDQDTNVILPRTQVQSVPLAMKADTASLAVNAQSAPWSGITGIPTDIANGIPLQNLIPVAMSGTHFTSIQTAIDSVTDATHQNQYVVLVAPGEYTESVTLKPYVHLHGSGERATTIKSINEGFTSATLFGASFCDVRDLTLWGGGPNTFNHVVRLDNALQLRFVKVTFHAFSGGTPNALYATGGSVSLIDCNIISDGAAQLSQGISLYNCESVLMDRVNVFTSGPASTGVTLSGCVNTVIRNCDIFSSGFTGVTIALQNNSIISCYNTKITSGGSALHTAIAQEYIMNLHECDITGSALASVDLGEGTTTHFANCKISGGTPFIGAGAIATCTNCYDENYVPSTYPTIP